MVALHLHFRINFIVSYNGLQNDADCYNSLFDQFFVNAVGLQTNFVVLQCFANFFVPILR